MLYIKYNINQYNIILSCLDLADERAEAAERHLQAELLEEDIFYVCNMICIYVYMYVYVCVYIYIERERECVCIYM